MKKMKALLLSLALGCTFMAAATAIGCNKQGAPSSENSSSTDWFAGEEESTVSLKFASKQVDVKQYETVQLECTVRGTASAVRYSSADESVATVDQNGLVTTKGKIEKVTITAEVDGLKATCIVNVEKTSYVPVITAESAEYTIENGETLQFSVATEWNKTILAEDIEYAVSFAENSKDSQATISAEGDVISVTGANVETIDIIVSATVRGMYTNKQITVHVIAPTLKIKPTNLGIQPSTVGYAASVSTTDLIGEMPNSLSLDFAVTKGGEQYDDAEIVWTVDGDAAILENGSIVGKKIGEVTITGTTTYNGEEATATVVCKVIPPEVHLDESVVLEIENLTNITLESELIGTLKSVELHGEKVSSRVSGNTVLFNKEKFPKSASLLGEQVLGVMTDLVYYTMDAEIYTFIINDAAELDQMAAIAKTDETEWSVRFEKEVNSQHYDGYFILGNDIDYNKTITCMTDTGTAWGVQGSTTDIGRGFRGVFDGKGYNIDGVTVGKNPSGDAKQGGGIFGYLNTTGVVKNVSFTNATLLANQSLICTAGNGTVENVSIQYKKLGGDKATEGINGTPRYMGSFFTTLAGPNATARNCLIDASAADITKEVGEYNKAPTFNIRLAGAPSKIENVVTLCPDDDVLSKSGADIKKHSYVELLEGTDIFASFDQSIWTKVEGVPMFANQAAKLDRNAPIEFLNVDDTLVAGFSMVVLANNPYVNIELEETEGVTYAASQLSATEAAYRKTVTLTATSLFNPEITATHTVYIDSFGKKVTMPATTGTPTIYNKNPILTIGDNSWLGEENYVYLGSKIIGSGADQITVDWQKLDWGKNEVTVVSVKEGEREHFVTSLILDYEKGDKAESTIVQDSVFSAWRGGATDKMHDIECDIAAPEGFEKVKRLDSYVAWPTALSSAFFDGTDLSGYTDIWFALKINNGRFVFQQETIYTSNWVYFHYTQTSDGVWAAEVTIEGNVYKTEFNIVGTGNQLKHMLYRSGWSNGFLLYNNNADPISEAAPTSVYGTEIRGV
ncbi:MAG: Ig-like domain-containing protein [Clostridia bacterium]|nr:Ig-like domain-containing protein [Clostridia bacterium]